ncbi:uncharacterized protein IL334_002537 [Kwoniella shivajii]|uniref:GAR domain-containing protein n=1 Tax=Kwoniella shivajii TaxID=564305 RepID=A0ABZ1CZ73_9TREE|nr:hypothetical protein IL334_002537 [Kwoniella shivajii]
MTTESDEELASIVQHISISDGTTSVLAPSDRNGLSNGGNDYPPKVEKTDQDSNNVSDRELESPQSNANEENVNYRELEKRIQSLSREISLLLDRIYEIQELRHFSIPSSSTSTVSTPSRIDDLLSSLTDSTSLLRPQITSLQSIFSSSTGSHTENLQDGLEELMVEWKKVEEQHKLLLEEMKEDGWLVRFRTTADQAEAMMNPLRKSLTECQTYVERIIQSTRHVPLNSEYEEQVSIENLQKISKGHESMTRTYVPSINKILKMMDKSISDRPIKNGESLRRLSEMSQRWSLMQKQLQQVNSKIRFIFSQHQQGVDHDDGAEDIELLADVTSPYSSPDSRGDYFGYGGEAVRSRESTNSSYSSNRTRESSSGMPQKTSQGRPHYASSSATLSPDTAMRPLPLRRRTSMMSSTSATTARTPNEKPRWDSSRKVPETVSTPTMPRRLSALPRSISPTPSNASMSSAVSRRLSRIPIATPPKSKGKDYSSPTGRSDRGSEEVIIPGLSVSNTHSRILLSEPRQTKGQNHLEKARMGLATPDSSRPRMSSTFTSFSRTNTNTPRTAPVSGRASLSRAPPSSFRITSPTPNSSTRPSSRLSTISYSNVNLNDIQEFKPSKYDLLDTAIQRIMEEINFNLFASRLDQSLKRGQRRNEHEEWKGEYIFGRGEKPSSVKLIFLAPQKPSLEKRTKCLVRVGGQWLDLKGELERRMRDIEDDETF